MPTIIHPDQTGFIIGRQLFGNYAGSNILYSLETPPIAEVVLSLDTHKAFDRIEYEYLYNCLIKFGFGPIFCNWIRVLYATPQAAVRTNNVTSGYFWIGRGTRQGCPLSPLLFDIAMEPLAVALREAGDITGINRGGLIHKVSLYADDLLLLLSNPHRSIQGALDIISKFGKFSGYKINLSKSLLFPINNQARQMSFDSYPLSETREVFTYLGVVVTHKFKDLFENNFRSALEQPNKTLLVGQHYLYH